MPNLGSAYIDVRADRSSLETDLDKAESQTKTAASNMQTAIGKVTFAAVAASAVSMGAVVSKAVIDGVRSLSELERKLLRTESIIRATGNAARLSSQELIDLANRIDLATLNDRDAILDAINAMQTFKTVSGETFKRSIELSVDLAEVMGTDLRSQVVQLGKALEDPKTGLTALRRVGVSFTEQQKEQISTLTESNRVLEAQAMILDAIAQQVGGAASGAAGGLSGKVDTLNFRWREFKENLATTSGASKAAASAIDTLSRSLEHLSELMNPDQNRYFENAIAGLESRLKIYDRLGGTGNAMAAEIQARIAALQSDMGFLPQAAAASMEQNSVFMSAGTVGSDIPGGGDIGSGDSEGGGPGGKYLYGAGDDYKDFWLTQADERYEILSRQYELESELENARIEEAKALEADFWQWRIQGDKEAAERGVEAAQWKAAMESQTAMQAVNNVGKALKLAGMINKDAFEAYKAYQIGETVISTASAAMKAYQAMASIPYIGPALGAAAAAAAIAAGAAQIAVINSASYSGGGSTSSISSSSGGAIGTYSADPATGVYEEESSESKKTIEFNFYGPVLGNEESIADYIVEKINDAEDRDVIINTSRQLAT